ncbi:MAG: WG repeat-containing protein [Bacteroidia bacterium]
MKAIFVALVFLSSIGHAQNMSVEFHPNSGLMALAKDGKLLTDYVFTEISEFSEGKAYAAKGELYAYIDTNGKRMSPYMFTVANNFKNGYAIIGDSFGLGVINHRMRLVVPVRFNRVIQPKHGLIILQSQQGYWGAYNYLGREALPFVYDLPPVFDHLDYIIVRKDMAYGVVNSCNEIQYNTSYQYIGKNGIAYRSGVALRLFTNPAHQ